MVVAALVCYRSAYTFAPHALQVAEQNARAQARRSNMQPFAMVRVEEGVREELDNIEPMDRLTDRFVYVEIEAEQLAG